MKNVTYITGNPDKARYFAELVGIDVPHVHCEIVEIQSLSLKEIVTHKAKEAYKTVGSPVLVEDVSLAFTSLNNLPGPFIKHFLESLSLQQICDLITVEDRSATARTIFCYFDGEHLEYFEGSHTGKIAPTPRGTGGYGWDALFEPDGYSGRTRAELTQSENLDVYLQIKPIIHVRDFLLR